MMTRKGFLRRLALIYSGIRWETASKSSNIFLTKRYRRLGASSVDCVVSSIPSYMRIPLGWKTFSVSHFSKENRTILFFQEDVEIERTDIPVMLIITPAINF